MKDIDKKNELVLLRYDKSGLIKKLKDIEEKVNQIRTDNGYRDIKINDCKLKSSYDRMTYFLRFEEGKFKFITSKIINFSSEVYTLDDLVQFGYDRKLLDVLFEAYTEIADIFESHLNIY